jgi:Flp pilus assembly protein TadG
MNRGRLSGKKRKGAVLMIMALSLLFIVLPAIGLAIDGAVVYSVRSMLQSATDAAAVAAAQSISRGLTPSEQYGSATTTAQRFFRANMNATWVPLTASDPVVTFPTPPQPRTVVINVASTVSAPTYFMRILNVNNVTVTAVSQTVRREVKIMMVLDRSGSLANSKSCDDLRAAAAGFTDSFIDGRDQIGMVTFGTSYQVDFPITTAFKSTSGTNLPTMINNIACNGGTNSAAAFWTGYQALVATPEAGVLNVILFFTDGQPNTVHMTNMEVKTGSGGSTCSSTTARAGVIAPSSNGTSVLGIYRSDPVSLPPIPTTGNGDQRLITSSTNCYFASNAANVYKDIVALTRSGSANEIDIFGNSLTGYKTDILRTSGRIRIDDNTTITNVGINALDSAARRARDDANTRGLDLTTFAIGLSNTIGSAEDELMKRVANTTDSTSYQSNRPVGMYVRADDVSQLQSAFGKLASDIMRFAK